MSLDATAQATTPGAHERHIASGTLSQQASQAFNVLVMLGAVTALGRTLTLSEFGLYGLLISVAGYLLIVQYAVEGAALRAIASALGATERRRVISTAFALYSGFGIIAALLIAGGGLALVEVLKIPHNLHSTARAAIVALGVVTALGWPFKIFQDTLRGDQHFIGAALADVLTSLLFGVGMAVLLVVKTPLWTVIALGGAIPLLTGVASLVLVRVLRIPTGIRPRHVSRRTAREMLGISSALFVGGLADIVIYSLDRVILGGFRSAAAIGLYEGAARPHNVLRLLHSTLTLTVNPVASRYIAEGDERRLADLLVRGTRYVLAVVVPVTVVLMVLSGPILEVWLGPSFRSAAAALTILSSYWLIGAATGVSVAMLIASGHVRELVQYAWMVAISNLVLSLALTPAFGLNGVVIGTTVPYIVWFPWFARIVLRTFPVQLKLLLREAALPAYSTAAVLAIVLGTARLTLSLHSLLAVVGTAVLGLALAWGGYYAVWLHPGERLLVRSYLLRRAAA
jgi:O-antigen/teichoic acid export membrane protein